MKTTTMDEMLDQFAETGKLKLQGWSNKAMHDLLDRIVIELDVYRPRWSLYRTTAYISLHDFSKRSV